MHFADKLDSAIEAKGNPICVGLDPRYDQLPVKIREAAIKEHGCTVKAAVEAIISFNISILDAVSDLVPVCKPQIAFYEEYGWEGIRAYEATVRYAHRRGLVVIGDAKRGDIGNTAQAYARGHLGFARNPKEMSSDDFEKLLASEDTNITTFDSDALTVNPYMGADTLEPFAKICASRERGIFVLVKTSNKGSGDLQDQVLQNGRTVMEHVAEMVRKLGEPLRGQRGLSAVGAVVGATYPEQAKKLRELMPDTVFLIPGYGAQGGSAQDAAAGFRPDGRGAIVNNSRGIIYAYKQEAYAKHGERDFAGAARAAVLKMAGELNAVITRK
jgi:orotidine-5'-phosphate decarboxylase